MVSTQSQQRNNEVKTTKYMVAITGNTFPVKEQLKALGARWNGEQKAWMIHPTKAEQARTIVAGAGPKKSFGQSNGYAPGKRCFCAECGEPYRKGQHCWEMGGFCTPQWE